MPASEKGQKKRGPEFKDPSVRLACSKGLKALRAERRLTQEQLASELGISKCTITKIEACYQAISLEMFLAICSRYQVYPSELLGNASQPFFVKDQAREEIKKEVAERLIQNSMATVARLFGEA